MSVARVSKESELLSALGSDHEVIVGFFGEFSQASRKALPAFESFGQEQGERPIYVVDVGVVKGLHKRFGVSSVPTVVRVKGETVLGKVSGVESAEGYALALSSSATPMKVPGADKKEHRVRVYVTDSCPWCTSVKSYLRQHHVSFSEVNVQRDESAAREMVRRSGQQGVPQVDIDGRMIVGFDKARIDSLLGLRGS
ncbi:MAG: thioredoxin family protein [Myxococcales bacterium]|nr:thioredoxin family protein [Myxococcales bacterium]